MIDDFSDVDVFMEVAVLVPEVELPAITGKSIKESEVPTNEDDVFEDILEDISDKGPAGSTTPARSRG